MASACAALLALTACSGELTEGPSRPGERPGIDLLPPPLHRLNQLEYNNTVRDLLGTAMRPADAFPPDSESNGFDNQVDALQLTPTLLDQYYTSARAVIDDALDDRPEYLHRIRPQDVGTGGFPVGDMWRLQGNAFQVTVTVPEGGATVTLVAGASVISSAPSPTLRFELDGAIVEDFGVRGTAASVQDHTHSLTLSAGTHTLRYAPLNFINDAPANISNDVIIRWVEVRADTIVPGPGRDLVYVCTPSGRDEETRGGNDACYRQILEGFARRAWRRPLESDERASLVALFDELRASGETDDQALRLVMRAVMTSPSFVYRVTRVSDVVDTGWLDPYVLASRLSYFLWSTMPDERLFAAAESGELATEEGLADAVDWMLEDEKAQGFLDGFVEQWLSTRALGVVSRSDPGFDPQVRAAMATESELFFADYFSNGRPVASMLDPDFAYLNDRLATHYGLPAVGSEELVRVDAEGLGRAGLLQLGAWLTVESDTEHSSPIKRGRWVSDRILCEPIPPPPPGLAIEPIVLGEETSVRDALEQHRSDPTCASCHAFLDVLGMGFEEFDGVGRRRADDTPLDTMGELPDGATFEGAAELAGIVDTELFVGCVTEKLFTYAVGRSAQPHERDELSQIATEAAREAYTLPEVIRAIVLSPAFRAPHRGLQTGGLQTGGSQSGGAER